jgi:hypothetical protein
MNGQQSLKNFYQSVAFANPNLAALISDDIITVALHSLLTIDNNDGQAAAERLRQKALDMPEIHRRVLESALIDLGYS